MIYKILADLVVFSHFLWVLFLFFGALFGRRNRGIQVFHLAGLSYAVILQISGWYCPLTDLEVWLRSKHDPDLVYTGSFIVHYVEEIVYVELSRSFVIAFSVFLLGLNIGLYLKRKTR
jgi:ABC-type multidrug transport system permease subunit